MEFNAGLKPNPNSQRIVRFSNIANFDFTPDLGAMYGGQPFPVKQGETKLFTFEVGDHLATHLARQMFLRKAPGRIDSVSGQPVPGSDRPLWTDASIEELKAKILAEAYVEEPQAQMSEMEALRKKIEELNKVIAEKDAAGGSTGYKDKAEVIDELTKRGIKFSPRSSKSELEKLLA